MSIATALRLPVYRWLGLSLIGFSTLAVLSEFSNQFLFTQFVSQFVAIPMLTALGFALAGFALLTAAPKQELQPPYLPSHTNRNHISSPSDSPPHIPFALSISDLFALGLLALGILALLLPANHPHVESSVGWLNHTLPQGMKSVTATEFTLTGLAILLFNHARTHLVLLLNLALVAGIGITSLAGLLWQLSPYENIYRWHFGLSLSSGIGFIVCCFTLLSIEFEDDRYQAYWHQDDSKKISLVWGGLLIVVGMTGGLGGFMILLPHTVNELKDNLELSLKNDIDQFTTDISLAQMDGFSFANQQTIVNSMYSLDLDPGNSALRTSLQRMASNSGAFGFSAVNFCDMAGRTVAQAGKFTKDPLLGVMVNAAMPVRLLWKDGFVLSIHVNIVRSGTAVGTMDAEYPLRQINQRINSTGLGKTTDLAVCAPSGSNINCFPFRSNHGKPLLNSPTQLNGQFIPMHYALTGKSGTVQTTDYRGKDVIAAYAPLGTSGLGIVLKIDAAELYEPIATTLIELLMGLLTLGGAGILLLQLQLLPLVRKLTTEISERKKAEEKSNHLAFHDALTDLPNRLLIQDRFQQAAAYSDRAGTKTALIFVDLDDFKTINDSLGHFIGDTLLKLVATRLTTSVRATDTVGRQGGDEFLIVLSNISDYSAIIPVAESILGLQADQLFRIEEFDLSIHLSAGIAVYPDDGMDFVTLLKKADSAMYQAKKAGKNTFRFYTEEMGKDANEHLYILNGLKKALENQEFVLHYQPQIDLTTNRIIGAEALIRWNHPESGLVMPSRFITNAEESGLIVPIGEWVLLEACRQANIWRQHGSTDIVVAVNLSAAQFKRDNLLRSVAMALAESGLPPSHLELELTESILIQDADNTLATIRQLKSLGIKLSIDDFGTGYSSLSYLKRFTVDKLKIDQSFIRDISDDADDKAIVSAIISMAKNLSMRTIAEGVETAAQLALLRKQGCDEVQGYYFSEPLAIEQFNAFVQAWK